MNLLSLLELEKLTWWCWEARAGDFVAYGPDYIIALTRLKGLWDENHSAT